MTIERSMCAPRVPEGSESPTETAPTREAVGTSEGAVFISKDDQCAPDVPWLSLDQVTDPGAYVCRSSGDLVRIVASGQPLGAGELLEKRDPASIFVTLVSMNPFVPITRARMEAADRDIEVNF